LIEGKRKKRKAKLVASLALRGGADMVILLKRYGNTGVSWRRVRPPLLIGSALEAVRKWRYEPTYLNDQPAPVQLNVTVTFRLNE
jgi:hypothetical protein